MLVKKNASRSTKYLLNIFLNLILKVNKKLIQIFRYEIVKNRIPILFEFKFYVEMKFLRFQRVESHKTHFGLNKLRSKVLSILFIWKVNNIFIRNLDIRKNYNTLITKTSLVTIKIKSRITNRHTSQITV